MVANPSTIVEACHKAIRIADAFRLVGIKEDEIVDVNDEIKLKAFVETILEQINSSTDEEPECINECLGLVMKELRKVMKEALTNVFVKYYYEC
jgi:hypothetical protein